MSATVTWEGWSKVSVVFGVLGPVAAWDEGGDALALKGPRHRAVLARLIIARRRIVPVTHLVDDLWMVPPPGAVSAVRTFVASLRRALEPERAPRTPARLLVTEGPGYALRPEPDAVDAWRFEQAVAAAGTQPPENALAQLEKALGWWRGPAYAEFTEEPWARTDRSRLGELRLQAVERQAEARLALGLAAEAVPDLDVHVTQHPWRENAWRLLALALYRAGRQGDALAVLRRARTLLVDQLGVDPGPSLRHLEADILHHADHLAPASPTDRVWAQSAAQAATRPSTQAATDATDRPSTRATATAADQPSRQAAAETNKPTTHAAPDATDKPSTRTAAETAGRLSTQAAAEAADRSAQAPVGATDRVWAQATAAYDRTVSAGSRARLDSTVGLLRNLAVTGGGGLEAARLHRMATIAAAEELGDPELTARVIGAYDVPAIWTRSDVPEQAAQVVAAAERALAALPPGTHQAARARLLATIALESRGTRAARGAQAARQAEEIARSLDDPALLAFALNAVFMQTFHRAGLARRRDEIGAELVALSARHGLVTFEVLGHLIRLQSSCALANFRGADEHAAAARDLAQRHELPLVDVFARWYRALRLDAAGHASLAEAETAYRDAATGLEDAGMPGLQQGLLPLALLCLRLRHSLPAEPADWGPYEPWTRPLVLLAQDHRSAAAAALREIPDPPRDLLFEALWCLVARAAIALDDRETMKRAHTELTPAATELAGAGSGLLTLGPVSDHLDDLVAALTRA